ncbi:hypothetical protein ACHAQH_000608 [Verticillium albo-atrum]
MEDEETENICQEISIIKTKTTSANEEDNITFVYGKNWTNIYNFSGFRVVTWNWELLENCLLFVDERTLLLAQRVDRYWYSVIKESHRLRCKLFFEQSKVKTWANIHPNPLLELVFHKWKVEVQRQVTNLSHTSDDLESKVLASWHILAIRWEGFKENHDRQRREPFSDIDLWDTPLPDGPVGRPGASWRRMLACQPNSFPCLDHPPIDALDYGDPWRPLIHSWPLLTEFTGSDVGPWPAAQFDAMAPFLEAETMARNAARLLQGTGAGETAQLRASWGPVTVRAPAVERDWFMFRPGAPTARMVSTGARSEGLTLREGEDVVFSYLEGLAAGKMAYRVLDLASQMTWLVTYWQHGEYLAWRSTVLGPARGDGLGRKRKRGVQSSVRRGLRSRTIESDGGEFEDGDNSQ